MPTRRHASTKARISPPGSPNPCLTPPSASAVANASACVGKPSLPSVLLPAFEAHCSQNSFLANHYKFLIFFGTERVKAALAEGQISLLLRKQNTECPA